MLQQHGKNFEGLALEFDPASGLPYLTCLQIGLKKTEADAGCPDYKHKSNTDFNPPVRNSSLEWELQKRE
ncbi:hypothetical protein GCM10011586_05920 [Silvibacterium dinghuense]|nr:hypothetical protein GCM10011586_05920 [Silvibacterium dinghuense]